MEWELKGRKKWYKLRKKNEEMEGELKGRKEGVIQVEDGKREGRSTRREKGS